MGFNSLTLMCLPFGLLLPIAAIIWLVISKNKKNVSFDSVFIGFGSFVASVASVAVVFIALNVLFLSSITFSDDTSGMGFAGSIIVIIIAALFVVCESFKMSTINKFITADTPREMSSVGFSAGVVLAQNVAMFIALNIFSHYEMEVGYAIFSGAIILVTGVMYTVIAMSCEVMLKEGFKAPAYALSAVYYLFWASVVALVNVGAILYVVSAFLFVLSFVLSGVFVFKFKKKKTVGEEK